MLLLQKCDIEGRLGYRRLRYAEWQARMHPLEGRLKEYREQHLQCTCEDAMPGPYIVVRIEDAAAGIGNELPGVITGVLGRVFGHISSLTW